MQSAVTGIQVVNCMTTLLYFHHIFNRYGDGLAHHLNSHDQGSAVFMAKNNLNLKSIPTNFATMLEYDAVMSNKKIHHRL